MRFKGFFGGLGFRAKLGIRGFQSASGFGLQGLGLRA